MFTLLLACTGEPAMDSGSTFSDDPPTTLGGDRPAKVTLPSGYSGDGSWPLVMLLHGYGANSTLQDLIFGLGPRLDELGFVLVQPEGTLDSEGSQFWNATDECCNFDGSTVDDVAYLSGLIDEARSLYPVKSVALVGHSNGGFMAYRMACEVPEKLDRIASLAGTTFFDESKCVGTTPVSVLHMHGTADDTIAYASLPGHAGAEESASRWATKAGCAEPPVITGTRDYLSSVDGEETTVSQWSGCAAGIDIQLWSIFDGDHYMIGNSDAYKDDVAAWTTGSG